MLIYLWFGVNSINSALTVNKEDVKKYISFLKNKFSDVKVFVSSYLSYNYDPVEGDNLLA